jgi:hypothetical protein
VIAVVLTLAGCSSEAAAPATPDGWRTVDGDGWSFAVPDAFRRSDPQIDPRRDAELIGPDELSPGQPSELVGISTPADDRDIDLDAYIGTVFGADAAVNQLQDYEVERERPVEVPGATQARRLQTSYTETGLEGRPTVTQSVVVAEAEDGRIWDLRYVAVGDAFDAERADRVAGAFALGS